MNEGTWVQGKSMNVMHQTGNVAWSIFDADYGKYNRMSLENGTGGGMFWDTMSAAIGQEFTDDDVTSIVESDIAVGNTVKADSIEELAALIGAPADVLKETIDRYNELCDQGTDADFGKKSAYMHKIEKAPFWGVRKHIRVSSIDSGVNTNANGQALDADGKVIEGLYCVGNVGGVFYGGADYPFHQTGLSLGRCYTFGMLAAKHAMGK